MEFDIDTWGAAYESALKGLGITDEDFRKHEKTLNPNDLTIFVNEYLPKHPAPTDVAMISRVVSLMAYVLVEAYPDESVRKLFAGFCQSLISYGWDLGEQCDDERDSLGV